MVDVEATARELFTCNLSSTVIAPQVIKQLSLPCRATKAATFAPDIFSSIGESSCGKIAARIFQIG